MGSKPQYNNIELSQLELFYYWFWTKLVMMIKIVKIESKWNRLISMLFVAPIIFGCSNQPSNHLTTAKISNLPKKEKIVNLDLDKILERKKIVVLTNNNYNGYFVYRGKAMGFEYELLKKFAKHIGVAVEVKVIDNYHTIIDELNKGNCDIVADNLAIYNNFKKNVAFTEHYITTPQVLVQKLPDNWKKLSSSTLSNSILSNPLNLAEKEVHVIGNSPYYKRLKNLEEEIGSNINIVETPGNFEVHDLIKGVAEGTIPYTVADQNVAKIYKSFFPSIHIDTEISMPQNIGWAVRKNSSQLLTTINNWLKVARKNGDITYIYKKYHQNRKDLLAIKSSEYSSLNAGKISKYDDIIKENSKIVNWDWRLISSLIYQESRFNHEAVSWAGAFGLMQLMPTTASGLGIDSTATAEENINAGIRKLKKLDNFWKDRIKNTHERVKFILGSYNSGLGHVLDACRLAEKYGKDASLWDGHVSEYLLLKAKKEYYTDEVVKYGYCRGSEPYKYVKEILLRFEMYKQVMV